MLPVFVPLIKLVDRAVIRMARLNLEKRVRESDLGNTRELPGKPEFFSDRVKPPQKMIFSGSHDFTCDSPLQGVAPQSRRIYGKFYRWDDQWRKRPVLMMLHGWNGENCYRFLFPLLALRCRRFGISLISFQLPCHGRRRTPSGPGADFISPDLAAMVQSTRQAIADAQSLIGWLEQEGCNPIGIWGISLGAWLAGLLACHDDRLSFAVLMTPISRMDRAIEELEFCAPIRRSLGRREMPFGGLNLPDHRPVMNPRNILLVEGRHDLFAPPEWVEVLWKAWNRPPIARYHHGHMSMLVSVRAMVRGLGFVKDRVRKAS